MLHRLLLASCILIAGCRERLELEDAGTDAPMSDVMRVDARDDDAPRLDAPVDGGTDALVDGGTDAPDGGPRCTSDTCGPHGSCDASGPTIVCLCDEGYAGDTCERCDAGFQDRDGDGTCQRACAASTCSMRGSCDDATGLAVCTCDPGHTRADCSGCAPGLQDRDGDGMCSPACDAMTCSRRGACDDASGTTVCSCETGYEGPSCGACAAGYQDRDGDGTCAPACAPMSCSGHGACDDATGVVTCTCDAEYAGTSCEACAAGFQDRDGDGTCAPSCTGTTCSGRGTCDDATGAAVCSCELGYGGAACELCAAGYQDNDRDGVCAAACAIAGCPSSCDDTSGTAVCTCTPACGIDAYCRAGVCAPIFADISGATDGSAFSPRISADARYVAFHTTGAAPGVTDTNGRRDVYVYDRSTGAYDIVSRAADGTTEGNGEASNCDMSEDGRVVAFPSTAANLAATDANGSASDVFVFDRTTRVLTHVSAGLTGTAFADSVSVDASGSLVVFRSNGPLVAGATGNQIYLFDRTAGTYELVSTSTAGVAAPSGASLPHVSADGRYVVFVTTSPLVASDTNSVSDVYLRDRLLGTTERVSVGETGAEVAASSGNPVVSAGGRFVAWDSSGAFVAADTNGTPDVFIRDRTLGTTVRASVTTAGVQSTGGGMTVGDLSGDGRYVTFTSGATNLAAMDTNGTNDVFVYDLVTSTLRTISLAPSGAIGSTASDNARLSPDGSFVVFNTRATNLVTGAGGLNDIVLRDLRGP